MIEELKDIVGYEGEYAINEKGNVWSYKSKRFLKPTLDKNGYHTVGLCKNGKKKTFRNHRLVAEAFIPNPDNLPEVNHKDEDKTNNCVDNLEWMSRVDNINYGTRNERVAKKLSKPIYCIELDRVFKSGSEAARELGLYPTNITGCCKGKRKTTGGYHFRYAETLVEEI